MDGIIRFLELPAGWGGSFAFDRQDQSLDIYFANLEAAYYSGVNAQAATITETIAEVNGSTTQWRYTGVVFKFDDAGSWKGDAQVQMKVSWMASKRLKVQ